LIFLNKKKKHHLVTHKAIYWGNAKGTPAWIRDMAGCSLN
jgi:hypothetical protein